MFQNNNIATISAESATEAADIINDRFINIEGLKVEEFYKHSIYTIIDSVLFGVATSNSHENSPFKDYNHSPLSVLSFCSDQGNVIGILNFLVDEQGSVTAILKLTNAIDLMDSVYGENIKNIIKSVVKENKSKEGLAV